MRFAIVLLLVPAACVHNAVRMETRALPERNPTTYVFKFPLDEVRRRVAAGIATDKQRENPIFDKYSVLLVAEERGADTWPKLLALPGNERDLYLHGSYDPLWESPVYRGPESGLPFNADFHVHFVAVGPARTSVSVTACDAEVLNGSRFSIGPCGPGQANVYVRVEPTSIEEYLILRYIGGILGVPTMPRVILPAEAGR